MFDLRRALTIFTIDLYLRVGLWAGLVTPSFQLPNSSIMKYLILFSLFVSLNTLAQVKLPTNEVGQVQYQELVRVPDSKRPARQIMEQVRAWSEQHYADEPTAEQQQDAANNILFIKAVHTIGDQAVRYSLTIETKFGRYRATLTDLITESAGLSLPVQPTSSTASEIERSSSSKIPNRKLIEQTVQQQADLYRQIDKFCRDTLASLKEGLK